jgi:hypothetical protein
MSSKFRHARKELPFDNFEESVARRNVLEFCELNKGIPTLCKFVLVIKIQLNFREEKKLFRKQ